MLKKHGISVIGTRNPTEYGKRIVKKFVKKLNLYDLTIISGMAEGIDELAHKITLESGQKTIAVLPCGFNHIFPESNKKLYEEILENGGLVITEYEEEEMATSNKFLERNRIVSSLSIGTLVVEGGYRSGTSVTAKIAMNLNRKVFCIPSSLENSKGITPNKLIKSGAILVTSAKDIIDEYTELNLIKLKETKIDSKQNKEVNLELKEIYNVLNFDEPMHINQIIKKTGKSVKEVSSKLMMLELDEKIVSLPGSNYKKI